MDVHMGHFDMGPIWDPSGEPDLLLISSFIKNMHFYLFFYRCIPNETYRLYFNEILKLIKWRFSLWVPLGP